MNHIKLSNGTRLSFSQIIKNSSHDLFQDDLHYSICEDIASTKGLQGAEHIALVNLYSLKSAYARGITSVVFFIKNHHKELVEISADNMTVMLLQQHIEPTNGVRFIITSHNNELISIKSLLTLLLKTLISFVYRCFRIKKPCIGDTVVRGWVDVTEKMYPNEVRQHHIFLFPFAFSFIRQYKFYRWCRNNCIQVSFTGLPYSIYRIMGRILSGESYDLIIAKEEAHASKLYSDELKKLKIKRFYTSDEFEIGSFALYENFITNGGVVTNTAHGVGNYSPYICYTEFRVLTNNQQLFYSKRNKQVTYVRIPFKNHSNSLILLKDRIELDVCVVLVHQSFQESGMPYENSILHMLDIKLAEYCHASGIPYFIKYHPNSRLKNSDKWQGTPIRNWAAVESHRPIFILLNSTAYFDLINLGSVLFYREGSLMPSVYFGDDIACFSNDNFFAEISNLLNPKHWDLFVKNQFKTDLLYNMVIN